MIPSEIYLIFLNIQKRLKYNALKTKQVLSNPHHAFFRASCCSFTIKLSNNWFSQVVNINVDMFGRHPVYFVSNVYPNPLYIMN